MTRKPYSTDLSDAQWALLLPFLQPKSAEVRPRDPDWQDTYREIINAIFYQLKNGCVWRDLPGDFPDWNTVYVYFKRWTESGLWAEINLALTFKVRTQAGKEAEPSVLIIDSQTVKTSELAESAGYDAGKKNQGS